MMTIHQKMYLPWNILPGIKITNVQALDEKGIDREKLVIDVHKVFFTMLLQTFSFSCRSTSWKHFRN